MHSTFKHTWLTNAAALSLIVFSVVGSISMLMPYAKPAQPEIVNSPVVQQIMPPRKKSMSYTLHQKMPENDAFQKEPNANVFKSVKRVIA